MATLIALPVALVDCDSGSKAKGPTPETYLVSAETRDLGQPPPKWLLLAAGNIAYVNTISGGIMCLDSEYFTQFVANGHDKDFGCEQARPGSWVRIRRVIHLQSFQYVVAITPANREAPVRYIGAADLSPNIPIGTELVVMRPATSAGDSADAIPELLDGKGNTIGRLLDHTRVRVRRILPQSGEASTLVAVTVLSGDFTSRRGFIDLDDLSALSGDDDLEEFLGAATG